jgi:hypothetical protein
MPSAPKKVKPRSKPPVWSCDTLAYTKRQCECIYEMLDQCGDRVVDVFDALWGHPEFTFKQRQVAPMLLHLVERIAVLKTGYVCGRNFERVWEFIHSGGKSGQIVYT